MKQKRPLIVYLCLWCLLFVPMTIQAEALVEAVIAVLNFESGEPRRKVIYFSDLERHRLFFENPEEIIIDMQSATPASGTITPFIRRRNAVINQALFLREAQRFAIKKPGEAEIFAKRQEIRQRFETEADFEVALKKSALRLPELKEEITDHLWVDQLIRERIQDFIFIGPKVIEAYQLNHLDAFIGQEIETIEKKITAILRLKKEVEKKQIYLKRLKEKVQIEFVLREDSFP